MFIPGPGSEFFPSRIPNTIFFIPDPHQRTLTQKIFSKLWEIWSGMFIPDPDPDFLPIPDPRVKKASDRRSGSATLENLLWNNPDFLFAGDSRGMGSYCQTARYKGTIVRIRELKFERKKDISRLVTTYFMLLVVFRIFERSHHFAVVLWIQSNLGRSDPESFPWMRIG